LGDGLTGNWEYIGRKATHTDSKKSLLSERPRSHEKVEIEKFTQTTGSLQTLSLHTIIEIVNHFNSSALTQNDAI